MVTVPNTKNTWIKTLYKFIDENSDNEDKYIYFNVDNRFDIYTSIDKPNVVFSVIFDRNTNCDCMIQFDFNGYGCTSGIADKILDMFKLGTYNPDLFITKDCEFGINTKYEINGDGMELFVLIQNKLHITVCSSCLSFSSNGDEVSFEFYNNGDIVTLNK